MLAGSFDALLVGLVPGNPGNYCGIFQKVLENDTCSSPGKSWKSVETE